MLFRSDLHDFTHVARYDETRGAVDSSLVAGRAHEVRIEALDITVPFARGEAIHTESSYKYSSDDLKALGEAAGLRLTRSWTDSQERFSVVLYTP